MVIPGTQPNALIAVDVGNARIKLGLFSGQGDCPSFRATLPEPKRTLSLPGRAADFTQLAAWLGETEAGTAAAWYLASVNRPAATRLVDWLRAERPQDRLTLLAAGDLPLVVRLPRPDMVGVDRLLDALAANRLRPPGRPAIVIDVGTVITVDLVSAEGVFLGGSILPGIATSARALHEFTDLLPLVDMSELADPPPALGDSTVAAMQSGLFWGAVGAVRQLIEQLAGESRPLVVLTGGASQAVAGLLPYSAQLIPHLTLSGIALAAQSVELP
jgi:type III pantothenate kinase